MNNKTRNAITHLLLHYLALACTILFCWVIYPYKWLKRLILKIRIYQAKREADYQCAQTNKAVYVIQDGMKVSVSNRKTARAINTSVNKKLAKKKAAYLDWDYRYGIIYVAYPSKITRC